MTLKVGDRAPDFTLPASGGGTITLSELLARKVVVLFFYPKDETAGCTAEACAFRDNYSAFALAGAQVVGVSSDPVSSHDRFASRHSLPMPLLSDERGEVRARYRVNAWLGLLPGRATFVIDRSGTVRYVLSSQLRFRKHVVEALSIVKRLSTSVPS
jgi:peroxiredoxin Q/BCP